MGHQFDYLQDAKTIEINRSEKDYDDYIAFFDNMLKKRVGEKDPRYEILSSKPSLYHLIMFAAFGNPRSFFDLVDEKALIDNYKQKSVRNIIKNFVDHKLWVYFRDAARAPQYQPYMKLGETLTKDVIIRKLLKRSEKDDQENDPTSTEDDTPELVEDDPTTSIRTSKSIYFVLSNVVYAKSKEIRLIFDYLQFGGIISPRGEYDMGHSNYGRVYAINIAIAIAENIINSDQDIMNLQIKGPRQFVVKRDLIPSMQNFKEIFLRYNEETSPEILKKEDKDFLIKTDEENKSKINTLFESLLNDSVIKLRGYLTTYESKLLEGSEFKTIRDVYDATIDDLQSIRMVGEVKLPNLKKQYKNIWEAETFN